MPLTAVSVMPLFFSQDEDDSEMYRPCVRLSSAEAELDAAICADRAAPEVHRPCVRLSSAEAELDAAICADRAAPEVHRPCVRLSSAEAELDAAICADRAARALVASYSEDVLTGPLRRYGRVRLFMGVSRV